MPDFLETSPLCLPIFEGDNGGATAQGVTADRVKVVVYYPPANPAVQAVTASYGISNRREDVKYQYELFQRYFNVHRETYAREVELVDFNGSGNDAQSQKADAVKIANDLKPFAVIFDGQSNPAMVEELNARGIICFCMDSQGRSYHQRFPGLSFSSLPTAEGYYDNVVDYIVKKGLARGPAEFAGSPPLGDPTYNDQRRFGLLYLQSTTDGTPEPSFDTAAKHFEQQLAANGVRLETKVAYRFDVASMQQQSTNIIAQFRTAGVNTIILFVDPVMPVSLTSEATRQAYFPEWFVTGTYVSDFSFFARTYDQQQWRHAYGISPFPLLLADQRTGAGWASYLHASGDPDRELSFYGPNSRLVTLFDGIHAAGPHLTPQTFAEGLFQLPVRITGNPFFEGLPFPRVDFTPQDPSILSDFAELWWDASRRGRDEFGRDGVGLYVRSNGGARYSAGNWPKEAPLVFERDPRPVVNASDVGYDKLVFDHAADGHTHDYDKERCRSCR